MPHPVDVVARPFAAFFEEAFVALCGHATVDTRARPCPRPDVIGTARLPAFTDDVAHTDVLRTDLCCECLQSTDECVCD